jgi:hypothetical protein
MYCFQLLQGLLPTATTSFHLGDYFIIWHRGATSESDLDHSKYTHWISQAQKMANLHAQISSQVFAPAVTKLGYVLLGWWWSHTRIWSQQHWILVWFLHQNYFNRMSTVCPSSYMVLHGLATPHEFQPKTGMQLSLASDHPIMTISQSSSHQHWIDLLQSKIDESWY